MLRNMKMNKIWVVVPLILTLLSCKREYTDKGVVGPTQIMASKDFKVTAPFSAPIDPVLFDLDVCEEFAATFNETVSWKIIITGNTSKGTKTLSGTSDKLDANTAKWCGSHDGLYFFEAGETVTAELIVSGSTTTYKTSFTIGSTLNYSAPTSNFQLVKGCDFETGAILGFSQGQFEIPNATFIKVLAQNETIAAPEGVYFCRISGKSIENNGFFVAGIQHRGKDSTATAFFPPDWTDPTKIFLNVYVRGIDNLMTGYRPFATLNFEVDENDNDLLANLTNCPYASGDGFCPPNEDGWVFKIPITHQGWKLFSCRYSDLIPSEDGKNGGFGNRVLQPQNACRVQFGLVSSPPFNFVQADIDFACMTYGAPYDPTK